MLFFLLLFSFLFVLFFFCFLPWLACFFFFFLASEKFHVCFCSFQVYWFGCINHFPEKAFGRLASFCFTLQRSFVSNVYFNVCIWLGDQSSHHLCQIFTFPYQSLPLVFPVLAPLMTLFALSQDSTTQTRIFPSQTRSSSSDQSPPSNSSVLRSCVSAIFFDICSLFGLTLSSGSIRLLLVSISSPSPPSPPTTTPPPHHHDHHHHHDPRPRPPHTHTHTHTPCHCISLWYYFSCSLTLNWPFETLTLSFVAIDAHPHSFFLSRRMVQWLTSSREPANRPLPLLVIFSSWSP